MSMGTSYNKRIFSFPLAILMLVASSCGTSSPQPIPAISPVTSTGTPIPSGIPVPSASPTLFITPSPLPTKTSTPLPGWVSDFTQPILSAIANLTPSFQDDFGAGSAGWQKDFCEGSMDFIEGELVATKCRFSHPNIDWRDFALEVDMRFLENIESSGEWSLHFRDLGNSGHSLTLYQNGYLAIGFTKAKGPSTRIEFDNSALSNDENHHILLIAKGNQFAFYVDNEPLYYTTNDEYRFGKCAFYVEAGTAAMDNFKIWDIVDIPAP